jgi:hypothetical protein
MPTEVEDEIQLHSTEFVEIDIMIEELTGITNKAKY